MPQGPGTYGSQRGRPPVKLRSGNTTPFKLMGSSPLKQDKSIVKKKRNLKEFLKENPYETGKTFKTGLSKFETAFSTARKAGKKKFTFKGKEYTTKIK